MNIPHLRDAKIEEGTIVLARVSLNVKPDPDEESLFRIKKNLATLQYLRDMKAKIVAIGHVQDGDSLPNLSKIVETLNEFISCRYVDLPPSKFSREMAKEMAPGEIVVLNNVRLDPGEKENSVEHATRLASIADVYVNEAFADSHRKHASIVGVPKHIPGYPGFVFEEEIAALDTIIRPTRPYVAILAGAKAATKLPFALKMAGVADSVFIGGALSNTYWKWNGQEVGHSYFEPVAAVASELARKENVVFPEVVIVSRGGERLKVALGEVGPGDSINDNAEEFVLRILEEARGARTVFWNGLLGVCEDGYREPTKMLAHGLAAMGERVVVGGGDTVQFLCEERIINKFKFVSSGGGAALDYLSSGSCVGLGALLTSGRQG